MALAPDEASGGGAQGLLASLDGGARAYTMRSEYPPRLRVAG